jgi:hypothetical protein
MGHSALRLNYCKRICTTAKSRFGSGFLFTCKSDTLLVDGNLV